MMMRFLFAASMAVLFSVCVPAAQAQCGCARLAEATAVRGTSPMVKSAIPTTAQHHVLTVAQTGYPHYSASLAATGTAGTTCEKRNAPDDKASGDGKPAGKADKEVTLTGTLVCAKCGLKEPGMKKCTNAIQVKDGEMIVTYFLNDKGNNETYHEGLCGGGTKAGAKLTGTITEKDGKRWVKVTKVEEKK
jgi:hypothetical protein